MEQYGGTARWVHESRSWTIRRDGSDDDEPISDEVARQLDELKADGEHVVIIETDNGDRVTLQ
jgi:hypothetical protein